MPISPEEAFQLGLNKDPTVADEMLWDSLSDQAQLAIGRLFQGALAQAKREIIEEIKVTLGVPHD